MRALFGAAALLIALAIVALVGMRQTHGVAMIAAGPVASGVPAGATRSPTPAVENQVTQQIGRAMDTASAALGRAEGSP